MTSKILSTLAFALFSVNSDISILDNNNDLIVAPTATNGDAYFMRVYYPTYNVNREGLAQMYWGGQYYSFCTDTTSEETLAKNLGDAFCKEMGYDGSISKTEDNAFYKENGNYYYVNSVDSLSLTTATCPSNADKLTDCSISGSFKTCTNSLYLACSSTVYSCETDNLELTGSNVGISVGSSFSACKTSCESNSNCNYLSYGTIGGNYNACYMYNSYTSKTYNSNVQTVSYSGCVAEESAPPSPTSSPTLAPTPTPPCETDNLRLYGTYNLFVGNTFSACKTSCESNSNCNYLSFLPAAGLNANRCYLYDTYSGKTYDTYSKTVSYTGDCVSLPTPSPTPLPTIPPTTPAPTTTIAPTTTPAPTTPSPTPPPASSSSRNTINYQLIMSLLFIVLLL